MKYGKCLSLGLVITFISGIIGCPTCVGLIDPEAPELFSQEFYETHSRTVVSLIQNKLLAKEGEWDESTEEASFDDSDAHGDHNTTKD
ncbi:hypothetical protein JW872_03950 [Candidatus Babeliales bacterium]|nr:hypothetical protein [Candidatus Babeliales bacterium]